MYDIKRYNTFLFPPKIKIAPALRLSWTPVAFLYSL